MHKRISLLLFLLVVVASNVSAQKIKYKDLFILLSAKQYAEAEPFLKKYLKDNDDNPNAYLFMGLILEDKASRVDVLKETERYASLLDSAVLYYGLATKGMTEKEVSKNDDYYVMYNRRDMRTGKFGVTHSDVILDLELRMKLKERARQARTLKANFVAAEASYKSALKQFRAIQSHYADMKQLYLRANDSLIIRLGRLATTYDSCHIHFNDYKATSKTMGKVGYNQDFNPQDIQEFKRELTAADFYVDDIKIQDFKRWAMSTLEVIDKEIKPLRDKLIARDTDLNKLQQQIKKDSVSVRSELQALHGKGFPELLRIDPDPLPLGVFAMKEVELDFGSLVVENRPFRDTAYVFMQVAALQKEIALARRLDSIASKLVERNIVEESVDYNAFVTAAYGTPAVLKSLIRSTKEMALREIIRRESVIKKKESQLRWIVDGTDSIPLSLPVAERSRFKPLVQVDESFTAGLNFTDSVGLGYFYLITPSRQKSTKASFAVNKEFFKRRYLPVTKALATQDDQGLVYFVLIYQEAKLKDKYQGSLTKIYKQEGLSWSVGVGFDQIPSELTFLKETSELTVKTKSSIGEIFIVTYDRDGKLVK